MRDIVTKLQFNESPFIPNGHIVKEFDVGAKTVNRYPDWDGITLRTALANHWQVPPSWVVVAGEGSIGLIQQAMIASGRGEITYGWPTFEVFEMVANALRMPIRHTELRDNACDLDAYAAAIHDDTGMTIVCTPNAPTGGIVSQKKLEKFIASVPEHVLILLDEAYGEFVDEASAIDALGLVKKYSNVVMSRTFSKAYGLAGVRVGYGIAQPELAERIAKAGVPFSVSVPAQGAVLAALSDQERLHKQVARIGAERRRLATKLHKLGIEAIDGYGNFVWLPLGSQAEPVAQLLRNQGVLVKAVTAYGLRITVGTAKETDALCAAWERADITAIINAEASEPSIDPALGSEVYE